MTLFLFTPYLIFNVNKYFPITDNLIKSDYKETFSISPISDTTRELGNNTSYKIRGIKHTLLFKHYKYKILESFVEF